MSWNILAFGVPALSFAKMLTLVSPASYLQFEKMPHSERTADVQAIVERVLHAENVPASPHYERIQDMLQNTASPTKTISALVQSRVKIVDTQRDDYPAFTTGTDADAGKYYIGLNAGLGQKALPWIIAHEISHILNEDPLRMAMIKAAASSAATALFTFGLGWSLLSSAGGAVLTNCIVHGICSQRAEKRADDFAIRHCSKQELEKGIEFFETVKALRESGTYSKSWIVRLLHPPEEARIAKIRKAIEV